MADDDSLAQQFEAHRGHPRGVNVAQLVAQIVGMMVVFALALFLPAGTAVWPAGWAFLALFFGFVVALSAWLLRFNPDLLVERMTGIGKADQKQWDKVFFVVVGVPGGWCSRSECC